MANNISTNIVRDESKNIDFVVTPNTKEIFERMFLKKSKCRKVILFDWELWYWEVYISMGIGKKPEKGEGVFSNSGRKT